MKKIILMIVSILLFSAGQIFAAGSCSVNSDGINGSFERVVHLTCTADSSAGTFPAITITGFKEYFLWSVTTKPGSTAPTDASDFTLVDATTGVDLLGAQGADAIDATDSITIQPYNATRSETYFPIINGDLTLNITQADTKTASAIIDFWITGKK